MFLIQDRRKDVCCIRGRSHALGGWFLVIGLMNQKLENMVRSNRLNIITPKTGFKLVEKKPVIFDRIFFPSSFSGSP